MLLNNSLLSLGRTRYPTPACKSGFSFVCVAKATRNVAVNIVDLGNMIASKTLHTTVTISAITRFVEDSLKINGMQCMQKR